MGGPVADRELSRAVRFAVAEEADEAAIRRLLRENPMRGAVSVAFAREPDYFRAACLAGGEDQTIVAYEEGRLACMGRCASRECWVNGQTTAVGYLAELRLDSRASRRFAIVRDGYRFFRAQNGDGLYFTSIASDNERARRLLESGARGMPAYAFLGELMTLLIAVPRRPRSPRLLVQPATADDLPALLRLLNQHGRRFQLGMVWTEEQLRSLGRHGLPLERIFIARARDAIIGCAGLWDQRSFRQTVIRGYTRPLAVARPWLNIANRILGRPPLPAPGMTLAQAFLAPLALADDAEALLPDLTQALLPQASVLGVEWLTLALPAGDPRLSALRKMFTTRAWPSRLYRVSWPEQAGFEFSPPEQRFLPEVSLL
jgi:hypothetical protein